MRAVWRVGVKDRTPQVSRITLVALREGGGARVWPWTGWVALQHHRGQVGAESLVGAAV